MPADDGGSGPPSFHPELAAAARWLPRGGASPRITPVLRPLTTALFSVAPTRSERVDLGDCSVYVYRPEGHTDPGPGVLWLHGGGLVFGDARQDEALIRAWVDDLGIAVASVQYRVAPKHPFPAPLDDCHAGWRWLAEQPWIDRDRLAVGGISAGGGLAAALCQRLRDEDGVRPVLQLLVYPMLDDRSSERATVDGSVLRLWNRGANRYGWSSYLRGWEHPPPHAVPARTEDLAGLPPAWIGVGDCDLFYAEDLDYARRLEEAGVPVHLELVEGGFHGFDVVAPRAAVSRAFHRSQREALAEALGLDVDPG